ERERNEAVQQRKAAAQQRDEAVAAAARAEGQAAAVRLVAQARAALEGDRQCAILLAVEAVRAAGEDAAARDLARGALLAALVANAPRRLDTGDIGPEPVVRISPDGRWVAVGAPRTGAVQLWDMTQRAPVLRDVRGDGDVLPFAFSPDSHT